MRLQIYSLKRTLFDGEAGAVNCQTRTGEITILDHHEALVTILAPGIIRVTTAVGEDKYFPVTDGFLEVKPDKPAPSDDTSQAGGGGHVRLIVGEDS